MSSRNDNNTHNKSKRDRKLDKWHLATTQIAPIYNITREEVEENEKKRSCSNRKNLSCWDCCCCRRARHLLGGWWNGRNEQSVTTMMPIVVWTKQQQQRQRQQLNTIQGEKERRRAIKVAIVCALSFSFRLGCGIWSKCTCKTHWIPISYQLLLCTCLLVLDHRVIARCCRQTTTTLILCVRVCTDACAFGMSNATINKEMKEVRKKNPNLR